MSAVNTDTDTILEALNDKADCDLHNVEESSRNTFLSGIMPDYSRAQAITMPYTAANYGWFVASNVNTTTVVYVNGVQVARGDWASGAWTGNLNCQILISPGDIVTGATGVMYFIPCKGL